MNFHDLIMFSFSTVTSLIGIATGPHSEVGNMSGYRCMSDCRSRGRKFDPGRVPYFRGDWSWINFYGHSSPFRWIIQEGLSVVLLLLTFCLLLLPLWESVIVLCFVVRYFMSILVLQSSWWGRESWLLCLICLPGVSWWLSGSSLRCHGVVCGLWLWYFLIILTYYYWRQLQAKVCARSTG